MTAVKFYVLALDVDESDFSLFEPVGIPARTDSIKCIACGASLSNLQRCPPHHYRLTGGVPGDLITDRLVAAVSQRFCEALVHTDLSGLEGPDSLVQLNNSRIIYRMMTPRCTYTQIDIDRSGAVIDEFWGCQKCQAMSLERIDRLVIREDTWTGEDIFMTGSLFSEIVVSQRFVDFVMTNELTNFLFIDQLDFHFDYTN